MKIYLAGVAGKAVGAVSISRGVCRLFSYIDLINTNRGFGAEDRFKEIIESKKRRKK